MKLGLSAAVIAALLSSLDARASEEATDARASGEATVPVEAKATAQPTAPAEAPRPWLYLDDPTVAAPLHVTAALRATYADATSPTRPFAANTANRGGAFEVGGEVGILPRVSIVASGFTTPTASAVGAIAGVRIDVLPRAWEGTHAVVSAGYLRELGGGDGAWGRAAFTQDVGRLRLGTTLHGEHVFISGRDAVDMMVMAGASYRALGPLRAGVEYVAQDLEGAFAEDSEKGVRHFLGPTGEVELLDRRLTVVAGPAFGLTPQSPMVVGRVALAYAY